MSNEQRRGPIQLGDISGGNFNFGSGPVGNIGGVVHGSVSVVQVVNVEEARARVDDMAACLAQVAHEARLQRHQIELLATDLARIRHALDTPEPDEVAFKSAAGDLWSKLMMVGHSVEGVKGLAEGVRFIARSLGWTLGIPGL